MSEFLLLAPDRGQSIEFLSDEGIRPTGPAPAWPSPYGSDLATIRREAIMEQIRSARATLMAWLKDPTSFADDDTDAPSLVSIRQGMAFLNRLEVLSEVSEPPRLPLRGVAIAPAGAIMIEFAAGPYAEEFVFEPDGSAERRSYTSDRLRLRHPIAA